MTIEERPLVTISLADDGSRNPELVKQLVSVAEHSGFFALADHGITEAKLGLRSENTTVSPAGLSGYRISRGFTMENRESEATCNNQSTICATTHD